MLNHSTKNLGLTLIVLFCLLATGSKAGIVVVNGLSHVHNLEKGDVDQGVIIVKNNGSTPEPVTVYQRDFSFNYKGETFYESEGTNNRSNTGWLVINPVSFVIEPAQEVKIIYETRVPNLDTIQGTYWSVIMIEPGVELDTNKQQLSVSINSVLRYAVQIITNVNAPANETGATGGDEPTVNLEFLNIEIVKELGKNYLVIDAENNGDIFLRTEMAVEIFDSNGGSIGVYKSQKGRTYPGTSKRYVILLPDLENGSYQSILVADSENDEVLGVELTLELSDD